MRGVKRWEEGHGKWGGKGRRERMESTLQKYYRRWWNISYCTLHQTHFRQHPVPRKSKGHRHATLPTLDNDYLAFPIAVLRLSRSLCLHDHSSSRHPANLRPHNNLLAIHSKCGRTHNLTAPTIQPRLSRAITRRSIPRSPTSGNPQRSQSVCSFAHSQPRRHQCNRDVIGIHGRPSTRIRR